MESQTHSTSSLLYICPPNVLVCEIRTKCRCWWEICGKQMLPALPLGCGNVWHFLSSLGVGNNSLCPFQIPSRKAIARVCGMLTLPVPAVLLVFGGLLMEHHPKDSWGALSFLQPGWIFPACCRLWSWLLQSHSLAGPGKLEWLKLTAGKLEET